MDVEEVNTSDPPQCEDNIDNVVELCRICLIEGVEMRDLFTENGIVSLSVKAMSFTTAKVRHVIFRLTLSFFYHLLHTIKHYSLALKKKQKKKKILISCFPKTFLVTPRN